MDGVFAETHNRIINQPMPAECTLIATCGCVQLYVAILLTVFSDGNPATYTVGYAAGISHLALSGLLVHRGPSPRWYVATSMVAAVAFTMTIGIVYQLPVDNSYWLITILNAAAVLFLTAWIASFVHLSCRQLAKNSARSVAHVAPAARTAPNAPTDGYLV